MEFDLQGAHKLDNEKPWIIYRTCHRRFLWCFKNIPDPTSQSFFTQISVQGEAHKWSPENLEYLRKYKRYKNSFALSWKPFIWRFWGTKDFEQKTSNFREINLWMTTSQYHNYAYPTSVKSSRYSTGALQN